MPRHDHVDHHVNKDHLHERVEVGHYCVTSGHHEQGAKARSRGRG